MVQAVHSYYFIRVNVKHFLHFALSDALVEILLIYLHILIKVTKINSLD